MAKYRAQRTSLIGGRLLHDRHTNRPFDAGWSSPVARQAHNLKVVGSNPTPATKIKARNANALAGFFSAQIWPICSRNGSIREVLLKSRLCYPMSSRTGVSMSHAWHMISDDCSPSVPRPNLSSEGEFGYCPNLTA